MQKQLKVSINGKMYTIATDEHEQDVYDAAQLVDSLVSGKSTAKGDDRSSLLVALQIATDLIKCRRLLWADERRLEHLVAFIEKEA